MTRDSHATVRWPRLMIITLIALIGVGGFARLGIWQVARLHWKVDLIERVDARIHAAAVPAPGPDAWSAITATSDEYRRVSLSGQFLNDQTVLIYTPSDFGPADWVLTPLERDDGTVVMINRGLVPEELALAGTFDAAPEGEVTVTGLLRMSEDKGWLFSRKNDPANGKWYRRDIGSITSAKGFERAAPYFIDADLGDAKAWPRGGQTVVSFRNAHLSYALTWFALAIFVFGAWVFVLWTELRRR
jgi:surfeit locus 1 family protein